VRRPGLALRAVVLLASALAAGTVVLAVGSRTDLADAGERVDAAWGRLRPALDQRYDALDQAGDAARERLGSESSLLTDLDAAIAVWRSSRGGPADAQVAAANRLEGLAARLAATVSSTPRLRSSEDVADALEAVGEAGPERAGSDYNDAVAAYEDVRGGFPRRLVAGALGYDSRRTLEVPA
jgi:hypothetical protein